MVPWFLPVFFIGFLLSSPPYSTTFLRRPIGFLCSPTFSLPVFENLAIAKFLGFIFILNEDQPEISFFFFFFLMLYKAKKKFKHISDTMYGTA
jgi:hypothetical protein